MTVCNGWLGAKTVFANSRIEVGFKDVVSQGLSADYNGVVHLEGSTAKI